MKPKEKLISTEILYKKDRVRERSVETLEELQTDWILKPQQWKMKLLVMNFFVFRSETVNIFNQLAFYFRTKHVL